MSIAQRAGKQLRGRLAMVDRFDGSGISVRSGSITFLADD